MVTIHPADLGTTVSYTFVSPLSLGNIPISGVILLGYELSGEGHEDS